MGLTQIYSILTQKETAQSVRAPLPKALINPQYSPASLSHNLAMITALRTSPSSSCLKELCPCCFIHRSVRRCLGGIWCPGIKCGGQHQKAVTATLGVASVRVRCWNVGSRGQTRWGSSLPYLPEGSNHPREELSLMWVPAHGENAALEQHTSP